MTAKGLVNPSAATTTLLLAALAVGGCASTTRYQEIDLPPGEVDRFMADKPAPLRPLCEKLLRQGFRNEVFNAMRVGLCAMELGDRRTAMQMFVAATDGIERILADDEEVMRIMKESVGEGAKPFKGEGYERAMAYYYRGLLHLREGDYFRARACFRAGLSQDAFTEQAEHRSDFALLTFLDGWASHWGGEPALAASALAMTARIKPGLDIPRPGEGGKVLVVAETGRAPRKVSDGLGHYMLKFRRGRDFDEETARIRLDGAVVAMTPIEDLYYQSRTRGQREIDYVLAEKGATFKARSEMVSKTTGAGETVAVVGSAFGGPVSLVGAGIGVAGMVAASAQINANPEADTRYWDNLPDKVHVAAIDASVGDEIVIEFLDANGRVVPGLTRTATVEPAGAHGLVWTRSRTSNIAEMAQRDFWDNLGN